MTSEISENSSSNNDATVTPALHTRTVAGETTKASGETADEAALLSFPMLDQVTKYLTEWELTYQVTDRRRLTSVGDSAAGSGSVIIALALTGQNSSYKTYLDLKEKEHRFSVYIETPVKIPPLKREAACEYLMRVNFSLSLGNFELNFRDGEVRYRYAIDVEGSYVSLAMVQTNVMVSAATADRFFPGLMAVVFAHQEPHVAFDTCRNQLHPSTTMTIGSNGSGDNINNNDNDDNNNMGSGATTSCDVVVSETMTITPPSITEIH